MKILFQNIYDWFSNGIPVEKVTH